MNITLYRNPVRALAAWNSLYRPMGLLDEVDQLARNFCASWRPGIFNSTLIPHTDIYEEKDQLVVKTELPGISNKDLEVTLEGNILTIRAEKKDEVAEEVEKGAAIGGSLFISLAVPARD